MRLNYDVDTPQLCEEPFWKHWNSIDAGATAAVILTNTWQLRPQRTDTEPDQSTSSP
eukprot:CAMPEP_0172839778 /NCGR_PEP_ID=MMETSP1075-20121228/28808_1 /TAXON_ID=2916 /ORGANISM="Ceratium fusus, Strain PA161109" /LENGTH=56 /DNA_ID=CAMNT_0013683473 /DNA_START=1 /DNA_END=171 /DNA_ORIENTATION=-